jgi:3'-phosphoadenosine 5'-phosphosulfate sulfotransferase (PAPS reductase)/FAD synthetase
MTAPAALPDLGAYRRFVVAFSGGKDSLAALLHLLSLGVPAHAIELHHHDVDGRLCPRDRRAFRRSLSTSRGVKAASRASWRDDAPTAPIAFETPTGIGRARGNGPAGTRGLFPQTSPDLLVRWCSPALQIGVLAAAIRNQPRFLDGRTLVITGERAEESPSRARYATLEPHRTSTLACGRSLAPCP